MAQLIDGKKISAEIKDELKEKVTALKAEGREITLAVIQVGNDKASTRNTYTFITSCDMVSNSYS